MSFRTTKQIIGGIMIGNLFNTLMNKDQTTTLQNIQSIEDADRALLELGVLNQRVKSVELDMKEEITAIRKKYDEKINAEQKQIAQIENMLHGFMMINANELFKGGKTIKLTNGKLLKRTSPAKCVCEEDVSWDDVLTRLKDHGFSNCIQVAEKIDKTALKKLKTDERKAVGVYLYQEINFKYELK